jgi:hypothetical protein
MPSSPVRKQSGFLDFLFLFYQEKRKEKKLKSKIYLPGLQ